MPGILESRLDGRTSNERKDKRTASEKRRKPEKGEISERRENEDYEVDMTQKASGTFGRNININKEEEDIDVTPLTEEDIRELNELEAMISEDAFHRGEKHRKTRRRITNVLLTIACVYLTILIYGTIVTEFHYDEHGEVAPVEMSVEDITNRNEYLTVLGLYLRCRDLYQEVLTLDYRMASGIEDMMTVAPEYEEAIDVVDALAVRIDATTAGSKYNQVLSMLYTWVNTVMFNYCRYMSEAVSQNNAEAANEAIAAREYANENFQLITRNMVTLGSDVKGYDITDIKDWSPDGYIRSTIEGVE